MLEVYSSRNRLAFDFRTVHRRELIRVRRLSTLQCHVDNTLTRIRAEHAQRLRLVEVENVVAHRERPAQRTSLTVALTLDIEDEGKLTLVRIERLAPVTGRVEVVTAHIERSDFHIRTATAVSQRTLRRNGELTVTSCVYRCGRKIQRRAANVVVVHRDVATIRVRHHRVFTFRRVSIGPIRAIGQEFAPIVAIKRAIRTRHPRSDKLAVRCCLLRSHNRHLRDREIRVLGHRGHSIPAGIIVRIATVHVVAFLRSVVT